MSDELQRILAMVKDGRLTEEQASRMIEALNAGKSDRPGRRRERNDDSESLEDLGMSIGDEVASIIDKSLRGLNAVLGSSTRRFGPGTWLNDSNVSVMSKLHQPEGEDYECRDNNFTVSRLADARLFGAKLCDNELHASSIKQTSIHQGEFRGNELRGSSIKDLDIDHGVLINCQMNGVQLSDVRIVRGKLDDCMFNGVQFRELGVEDSSVSECRFNGAKVNGLNITDNSTVSELKFNGVKCQDLTISSSRVDSLKLSGLTVEDLEITGSVLTGVVIRNKDWKEMIGRNQLPSPVVKDLKLDHFNGENLQFVNCNFSDTGFRNFEASNMIFTEVDFSGLTIESAEDLSKLADEQAA